MITIKEVFAQLLEDVDGVSDAVGSGAAARIYPETLPEKPTYPSIVYAVSGGLRVGSSTGGSGLGAPQFDVTVWDDDYVRAEELAQAILAGLEGQPGDVTVEDRGTITVNGIIALDPHDEFDDVLRAYGAGRVYEVWHNDPVEDDGFEMTFRPYETLLMTGLPRYIRTGAGGQGTSGLAGARPMYTHQYGVDNQPVVDLSGWPAVITVNTASVQATATHAAAHGYDVCWDLEDMFGLVFPVPDAPTSGQQVLIDRVLDAAKAVYDASKAVAPAVLVGFYSAPCEASYYIPLNYAFDPVTYAAAHAAWLARNDRANKRWNGAALVASPASAWNDYIAPSIYEFNNDTYSIAYSEIHASGNVAMCRQIFPGVPVYPFVSWEYPDFGGSTSAGKQLGQTAMAAVLTATAAHADGWILWGGYKPSARLTDYKQVFGTGNVAAWQAVTDGVLKVVMAQVGFSVSGLDFSSIASIGDVAPILEAAINARLSAGTMTVVSPWTPTSVLPNVARGTSLAYPYQLGPVTVEFDGGSLVINSQGGKSGTPNGYQSPPDGSPRLSVFLVSYPDAPAGTNIVDDAVFLRSYAYSGSNPVVGDTDPSEWNNGWGAGTGWFTAYTAKLAALVAGG